MYSIIGINNDIDAIEELYNKIQDGERPNPEDARRSLYIHNKRKEILSTGLRSNRQSDNYLRENYTPPSLQKQEKSRVTLARQNNEAKLSGNQKTDDYIASIRTEIQRRKELGKSYNNMQYINRNLTNNSALRQNQAYNPANQQNIHKYTEQVNYLPYSIYNYKSDEAESVNSAKEQENKNKNKIKLYKVQKIKERNRSFPSMS